MPRTSDVYPDKYMKAHHLEEMAEDPDQETWVFTIASTGLAEYDDGKKQITLRFRETHLELGLNKGNSTALEEIFQSDESDDWIGKKVAFRIEVVKNSFAPGGKGPAIRVADKATRAANRPKEAKPPAKPASRQTAPPVTQAEVDADEDLEIPF